MKRKIVGTKEQEWEEEDKAMWVKMAEEEE